MNRRCILFWVGSNTMMPAVILDPEGSAETKDMKKK